MYAVGFVNCGSLGMAPNYGNDGMMKIYHKSMKYILDDTRIFRNNNDEVYLINEFTQEMCEMNSAKLYDKVRSIGKRIK